MVFPISPRDSPGLVTCRTGISTKHTEYRIYGHHHVGHESEHFHIIARSSQPDRHRRRPDRNDRMVEIRSVANRDSDLPGDHHINERDRLSFPVYQIATVAYRRDHFIGDAGIGDVRVLREASVGFLAYRLCGDSGAVALPERIRSTRAGVHEDSAVEGAGADTDRAGVRGCAGNTLSTVPGDDDPPPYDFDQRSLPLSDMAATSSLMGELRS